MRLVAIEPLRNEMLGIEIEKREEIAVKESVRGKMEMIFLLAEKGGKM